MYTTSLGFLLLLLGLSTAVPFPQDIVFVTDEPERSFMDRFKDRLPDRLKPAVTTTTQPTTTTTTMSTTTTTMTTAVRPLSHDDIGLS